MASSARGSRPEPLQNAQGSMAKIHNVEVSTRAGQVDAAKLAQLQRKGVPLTGGLKIIADTAENFPNITRHSTKLAGLGGIAMPTTAAAFAHKVIGTVAGKLPGVSVATDRFQNRFGNVVSPERASYHAKRKATKKGDISCSTGHGALSRQ